VRNSLNLPNNDINEIKWAKPNIMK
jgi:hypothetical protein